MSWESCDTHILFFSLNAACPEHPRAVEYLRRMEKSEEFALCELVLLELYVLLRNPVINDTPLSATRAADVIQRFRKHPLWRLVDYPGYKMEDVWAHARAETFPRRAIFDTRLALTLRHYGVTRFATRNLKHFQGLGFDEVFDPITAP